MPRYQTRRAGLTFLCAVLLVCVTACGGTPRAPDDAAKRQITVAAPFLPDSPAYAVDASASEIQVRVYRDGLLGRFGHNHLITGPVTGRVHAGATAADSGFLLRIPVTQFRVDPPAARAAAGSGFEVAVSDAAQRDTRENMLGEAVLDAAAHPEIRVASIALSGPREHPDVIAHVTLRGAVRELRFPATVAEEAGMLTITAQFALRQSEFGIEPLSVLGGGLQVGDEVGVSVRIVAHRSAD